MADRIPWKAIILIIIILTITLLFKAYLDEEKFSERRSAMLRSFGDLENNDFNYFIVNGHFSDYSSDREIKKYIYTTNAIFYHKTVTTHLSNEIAIVGILSLQVGDIVERSYIAIDVPTGYAMIRAENLEEFSEHNTPFKEDTSLETIVRYLLFGKWRNSLVRNIKGSPL